MKYYEEFILEKTMLDSKERIHNTSKIKIDFKKYYEQPISSSKPKGIWYGFGESWLNWVRTEIPEWEYEHTFKFKVDTKKILRRFFRSS
jgi:hypothetical protein